MYHQLSAIPCQANKPNMSSPSGSKGQGQGVSNAQTGPTPIPQSLASRQSYQAGPSTLVRIPSQSSFTTRNARLRRRRSGEPLATSLSHLDLSDSAAVMNALAVPAFSSGKPRLTRQTTYSSLPPSPRLQAAVELGLSGPRDLEPLENAQRLDGLEEALSDLSRKLGKDPPGWSRTERERQHSTSSDGFENYIHDDNDENDHHLQDSDQEAGHDGLDGMDMYG